MGSHFFWPGPEPLNLFLFAPTGFQVWAEDTSCWGSLAALLLTDVVEEYAGRPLVLFSLRPHGSGQVRTGPRHVPYPFLCFRRTRPSVLTCEEAVGSRAPTGVH